MKKLFYIANIRMPTEKAHGIQIMKSCEAIADQGTEVILFVPSRNGILEVDPFAYYKVKKNFTIKRIPSLDLISILKNIGFNIQTLSFIIMALFFLPIRKKDIFFYSRDQSTLIFLSYFTKNIFWESHMGNLKPITKKLLKKTKGLICISQGLVNFYIKSGVNENKICLAPDAVDLGQFKFIKDKISARRELNLPEDKKIITYTGSMFYTWKGVDVLLSATKEFDNNHLFVFVGGNKKDIKKITKNALFSNVLFVGQEPHEKIPLYLQASDVLILPNKKGDIISEEFTSPMKLFEYMASGKPIIASDLPSIREILNVENSILVEPNDPQALTEGINKVLSCVDLSKKISSQALEDIKKYSWEMRGKKIVTFLQDMYEK